MWYKTCVTRVEDEKAFSKVKDALVAHEIGTDYYVLATENGNLMACCSESLESLRNSENLIFFDEVIENVLKKQEELERRGIIPAGASTDYGVRHVKCLIQDALLFLGFPPKTDVEFFSLPKRLVNKINWISSK